MSTPPIPQSTVSHRGMLSRSPGATNLPSRPMMMPAMMMPMMSMTGDPSAIAPLSTLSGADNSIRYDVTLTRGAHDLLAGVSRVAAQQRDEHRVGAVAVRPQLHVGPATQLRNAGQDGARVEPRDVRHLAQDVGDDDAGLGDVRGTGDVGDDATRPDGPQAAAQQTPLQRGEPGDVRGFAPPARLGPAPQGAEPGARRVDEDPVERGRRPRRDQRVGLDDERGSGDRGADEPGPVRGHLDGEQHRAALTGQPGEQGRL